MFRGENNVHKKKGGGEGPGIGGPDWKQVDYKQVIKVKHKNSIVIIV